MEKKKRIIVISSLAGSVLVIVGIILGLIFGIKASNENKEELYQKGLKHLIDGEYQEASDVFATPKLKNYKDTLKKYSYSFNLQRYEQHYYSYEDLIYYGLSEKDSVANVDFNTLGGEAIPRKTINKQTDEKFITEVAVKEHCDFTSWALKYATYELSTDSLRYILEAKYSDHPYTITYDLDGGTSIEALPKTFYYDRGDVSISDATKDGYSFIGYTSNIYEDTRKNFVIPNHTDVDVNLVAKYEPLSYTVTLNANGGTVDPTEVTDVTFGEDVSYLVPTPTKDYCTFSHWTYQGEPVDLTNWSIAGDVELLAEYTPTKYSISYSLNGAHYFGLPTKYDYLIKINLPNVEKKNAVFLGWKQYGSAMAPVIDYQIGYGTHGDLRFDAIFANATIDENGVLQDIEGKETLQRFVIPSYVKDISPTLFSQMPELANIHADAKNKHFSVSNNILIKDKVIAFAYPAKYFDKTITLPETITEIAENAFKGIDIQKTDGSALVEKIGANAFLNCTELVECNLHNISYVGNSAFENTKINEGFLSDNASTLAHIGDKAFKNTKVNEINIGGAVLHIGDEAFANLSGAGFSVVNFYPDKNCEFGDNLFKDCSGLKTLNTDLRFFTKLMTSTFNTHSLTTINLVGNTALEDGICKDYTSLKSVDLSSSAIIDIPANAFKGDTSLESAKLPSTLRRIKANAFEDCGKLSTVNFNELSSLIRIESNAFKGSAIEELDFTTASGLSIADHAFDSCLELTSIKVKHGQVTSRFADVFSMCSKIDEVVYEIPETSDEEIVLKDFLFENLNNVTSINIKYLGSDDKLITFGNGGFKNCASLSDLTLTNCHVASLPNYCFEGCISLTNASEQFSNLTSYGEGVFYGCSNLEKMSFSGTNEIGRNAFAGCFKLISLSIPHNDALKIGQAAFAELSGTISIDYTAEEVADFREGFSKWYHFDDGFSGILNYAGA